MYSNKIQSVRENQNLMSCKIVFSTLAAKFKAIKNIKTRVNHIDSYLLKQRKEKFIKNLL
jgi:hypothetical protein